MPAPRYLVSVGAALQQVVAAVIGGGGSANALVATNGSGVIDPSFLPAGVGQDIVTATASEALAAGALVNLYNNAGALGARNADATSANGGKKCGGFVIASVASGATASVYRSGLDTGVTGLTPGTDYFLGTAGGVTVTPDTTSGHTSQFVGTAISATSLDVQPGIAVGIA